VSNYQQMFDHSYARVVGEGIGITEKGKQFFSRFYDHFFKRSDEIRERFKHTDMEAQVGILHKSMYHMIGFYILNTEHEALRRIAQTHAKSQYDIKPEFYDHWVEALILTVADLDPKFDREVELAWRLAMSPGVLYMKMHYDDDVRPITTP
jgi:hemoglobin-like flavoprotein